MLLEAANAIIIALISLHHIDDLSRWSNNSIEHYCISVL
jgi:hypothetical protein